MNKWKERGKNMVRRGKGRLKENGRQGKKAKHDEIKEQTVTSLGPT